MYGRRTVHVTTTYKHSLTKPVASCAINAEHIVSQVADTSNIYVQLLSILYASNVSFCSRNIITILCMKRALQQIRNYAKQA